jgi:hypothetical protein
VQNESAESQGERPGRRAGFLEKLHGEWMEILATILLAVATISSACCAYQAARWRSQESMRFNEATADRVHAAEADDLADTELDIDLETFLVYVEALRAGDTGKAQYFENKVFRDEMMAAVEAWKATDPLQDPEAPGTPFEMPQYVNANREEAKRLEAEASRKISEARDSIDRSDFYILLTVLFASVLFFAGICTKFKTPGVRISVLAMGIILLSASLVVTILQPVL